MDELRRALDDIRAWEGPSAPMGLAIRVIALENAAEAALVARSEPDHGITDPNAPIGYQCGDPGCPHHGLARSEPGAEGHTTLTQWEALLRLLRAYPESVLLRGEALTEFGQQILDIFDGPLAATPAADSPPGAYPYVCNCKCDVCDQYIADARDLHAALADPEPAT